MTKLSLSHHVIGDGLLTDEQIAAWAAQWQETECRA
jgi:hypothetical protein